MLPVLTIILIMEDKTYHRCVTVTKLPLTLGINFKFATMNFDS